MRDRSGSLGRFGLGRRPASQGGWHNRPGFRRVFDLLGSLRSEQVRRVRPGFINPFKAPNALLLRQVSAFHYIFIDILVIVHVLIALLAIFNITYNIKIYKLFSLKLI